MAAWPDLSAALRWATLALYNHRMSPTVPDSPEPRLSDWNRLAQRMGPNLGLWLLLSGIAAGALLFVSPAQTARPMLVSIALLLLPLAVFLLGWMAGMSTFAISCDIWRRGGWSVRLVYLLPILLSAITALGLLGGGYWWLLSVVVALLGHRKGTQRAWWGAVSCLAFTFRSGGPGMPRLAESDAEALSYATDAINNEIGRRPRTRT